MVRNLFGDVLIVEGEIKAMVVWSHLWKDDGMPYKADLSVIGLPGKNYKQEWIETLKKADNVFICLDPDAEREAKNLEQSLNGRAFKLPGKIDDLFLNGCMDAISLLNILYKDV